MYNYTKKQHKKGYKKLRREQRKEMKALIKADRPWDYEYLRDWIRLKIKHTYEYFEKGYNIFSSEENINLILNQLKEILDLFHTIDMIMEDETLESEPTGRICGDLFTKILMLIGEYHLYWWD